MLDTQPGTKDVAAMREFHTVPLAKGLLDRYRRDGVSTEESIGSFFARAASRSPWLPAVSQGGHSFNYGQVLRQVEHLAGWLADQGVGPGSVVTWQLPNWWEAYVVEFAIWHAGAVSNPVLPISREHELRHMVGELEPDAVIVPRVFRDCDHVALLEAVLDDAGVQPKAKIVVRGAAAGWTSYDEAVARGRRRPPVDSAPDEVALVQYTSGTTSAPKGAMHTARSLLGISRQTALAWGCSMDDAAYMPAPVAHVTGMLVGMTCPAAVGASVVFADRWDAELAVREMTDHAVSYSAGATVFLQELVQALHARRGSLTLRGYGCGGAPVPPQVVYDADELGIRAFRIYGMTELPCATLPNGRFPVDARALTDGRVALGVEIEAVDASGAPLAPGAEGELRLRGFQRMAGYVNPGANRGALDDDGWFHSGDVGSVDEEGFVRVTGRIKDIVNRGGEKISARDLEDVLARHSSVMHVAVVSAPHRRLGEVPAAFVVLRPGQRPDEGTLAAFMRGQGVAKQKLPERWLFVDALPRTASGKVKKFELVERLADSAI